MKKLIKNLSEFTREYADNEIIFSEGDIGNCAYLIEKGQVEIFLNQGKAKITIANLEAGEIFGEMAVLDGPYRSASAKAHGKAKISVVTKETLNERIEKSDPVVKLLMTMLIGRIRKQLTEYKKETPQKGPPRNAGRNNIPTDKIPKLKKITDLADEGFDGNVVDKIRFEKDLQEALDKNEFHLKFQPILDTQNKELVGVEALTRWDSKDYGTVRPDIFMGVAEETSLIIPLGRWILKQSCKEFGKINRRWKESDEGHKDLFISINVSGRQFYDKEFFQILQKSAFKNQILPKQIKLEITERVLITGSFAFNWIKKCRDLGYSVALDDFGTGYSCLSYLSNLDINNIKIDKSFIKDLKTNKKNTIIVNFIVQMCKNLNMTIIAEGIENEEQYKIIKDMNCTYSQGFLFYRPMTSKDIIATLINKKIKKIA